MKKIIVALSFSACVLSAMPASANIKKDLNSNLETNDSISSLTADSYLEDFAAPSGFYVSGQLGYANTHMGNKLNLSKITQGFVNSSILGNNGLAGRVAIGYQLNHYLAVEAGYLQLNKTNINANIHFPPAPSSGFEGLDINARAELKQNAFDILGKANFPVTNQLNVYGKFGMAYLTTNLSCEGTGVLPDGSSQTFSSDNETFGIAKHKWAPEVAVGVSYNITRNVALDTSWTHIQPLGKNRPGNIDFFAAGLSYNFG